MSFPAGVESGDQCLLNFNVLSCFSGVIMSIRSFFLFVRDLTIPVIVLDFFILFHANGT